MKNAIATLGTFLLLSACGGGDLKPGEGDPLSILDPQPTGGELAAAIDAATPVESSDLVGVSGTLERTCEKGGVIKVSRKLSETRMRNRLEYKDCEVVLLLNGVEYEETITGEMEVAFGGNLDGPLASQSGGLSFGGDIGFAVRFDLKSISVSYYDHYDSGECVFFDAADGEIQANADQVGPFY